MKITISQAQDYPSIKILRIEGDIDMNSVDQFEQQIKLLLNNNEHDLLLDLSGVSFISSAGVRSLNALFYQLHPESSGNSKKDIHKSIREGNYRAPHLKILNPQPHVLEMLDTVGVNMFIPIYFDEIEAVAAF